MSIEQLLLLTVFIILPLIQSLFARLARRRSGEVEPESESALDELPAGRAEKPRPAYKPLPARPLPKTRPAVIVRPRSTPAAEPEATRPPAAPARPPLPRVAKRGAQSRHLRELVPRDVLGLRRAVLLAEVLGRPRSLDRSDPFTR